MKITRINANAPKNDEGERPEYLTDHEATEVAMHNIVRLTTAWQTLPQDDKPDRHYVSVCALDNKGNTIEITFFTGTECPVIENLGQAFPYECEYHMRKAVA